MKEIANEILKKINERNIVWAALTIILSVVFILIFPSLFKSLKIALESAQITSPYSFIFSAMLYFSLSIIIVKTISFYMNSYQINSLKRKKIRIINKLNDDDLTTLLHFAVYQERSFRFNASYTHKARLLENKGIISSGPNSRYADGSERFYISKDILNYLTVKFHDEIDNFRVNNFSDLRLHR